jgi:hypothetical protein
MMRPSPGQDHRVWAGGSSTFGRSWGDARHPGAFTEVVGQVGAASTVEVAVKESK